MTEEKKREESPSGRHGSAQMKELICTYGGKGGERGKGKYLQNEKGTKIFTARARMEFFSLSIFFFFTFRLEGKYPDWREGGEEENSTYFKLEIIKLPT